MIAMCHAHRLLSSPILVRRSKGNERRGRGQGIKIDKTGEQVIDTEFKKCIY